MSSESPYVGLNWGSGTEHYVGEKSGLYCLYQVKCSLVFFAEEEVAPTSGGWGA
jgi:hypothetical protein